LPFVDIRPYGFKRRPPERRRILIHSVLRNDCWRKKIKVVWRIVYNVGRVCEIKKSIIVTRKIAAV
jgi:hypothetical protein